MKVSEALKSLNLRKYHALIKASSGRNVGLAIKSETETITSDGVWSDIADRNPERLESGIAHRANLFDYQLNPVAEFLLVEDSDTCQVTRGLFEAVLSCAQEELALTTELLEMTDELTSRYEELNLVFSNQERGDLPDGIELQLRDIVDSSTQYMHLSLCFMVLGNHGMSFLTAGTPDLQALGSSITLLARPVTKWLEVHQGSHVFNRGLEFSLEIPEAYRDWRHIITPITVGSNNNVAGFIVVARTRKEAFFTNSDKNLLEVMAQKASKLIRSNYDDLTRLLRRSAFQKQLESRLVKADSCSERFALLLISVDRMQVINEAHSHEAGNEVLKWLSRQIENNKGANDIAGRFDGDQFLLLLEAKSADRLEKAARKTLRLIHEGDFHWHGAEVEVSVSAGLAIIEEKTRHAGQAMAEAEFACSAAKEFGGGKLEIFASGDAMLLERHAQLNQVSVIQNALKEDQFVLYVQPIKPLIDKTRAPHAEVLIRLQDQEGQIVPPGLFLPAAERFNLMPAIDKWVIEHALSSVQRHQALVEQADLVLAINLSGQALSDSGFIHFLRETLDKYNPRPGSICLEVTETTAIRDMQLAREFMSELRARGVLFALDDFGTGLSSFSYLQQLPLDTLKIDGSFVREIVSDEVARTMVKAINDVGQSMGMTTVAEFVSSPEIEDVLKTLGVDYGQGFSLAKPMPLEDYLLSLNSSPAAKSA